MVRELIDAMLREDLAAPVKQRHTCRRIFQRLVDEHRAMISYSSVVNYVGHRSRPPSETVRMIGCRLRGRGFEPEVRRPWCLAVMRRHARGAST